MAEQDKRNMETARHIVYSAFAAAKVWLGVLFLNRSEPQQQSMPVLAERAL